ncbi:DUF91 domain-containing protein [bacterium]|nr:DUF91 domain-containing protein [bacterium]
MKRVQLWSVNKVTDKSSWTAEDVLSVDTTETENLLESLLVDSPRLLMEGMTLIGRQVPTEGGPLDLAGVDISLLTFHAFQEGESLCWLPVSPFSLT